MASIVRRDNKSGITYRIQVKTKDKGSGQIITHSTTWKPIPGMSEKQIQREVIVFADQYEAQIKAASLSASGEQFMSAETTLGEFADWWLERRKNEISLSYFVNCHNSIDEIKAHIGAYKLRELNPSIIQRYYDELDKRERTVVTIEAKPDAIRKRMEETGKNYMTLRYTDKINCSTLSNALNGGRVQQEFADQLAKLLETDVKKLFTITKTSMKYAFESNHKIKRTLRVILATAKKAAHHRGQLCELGLHQLSKAATARDRLHERRGCQKVLCGSGSIPGHKDKNCNGAASADRHAARRGLWARVGRRRPR